MCSFKNGIANSEQIVSYLLGFSLAGQNWLAMRLVWSIFFVATPHRYNLLREQLFHLFMISLGFPQIDAISFVSSVVQCPLLHASSISATAQVRVACFLAISQPSHTALFFMVLQLPRFGSRCCCNHTASKSIFTDWRVVVKVAPPTKNTSPIESSERKDP